MSEEMPAELKQWLKAASVDFKKGSLFPSSVAIALQRGCLSQFDEKDPRIKMIQKAYNLLIERGAICNIKEFYDTKGDDINPYECTFEHSLGRELLILWGEERLDSNLIENEEEGFISFTDINHVRIRLESGGEIVLNPEELAKEIWNRSKL